MIETWDLFDKNNNFKGTFIRGNGMIPQGLYHKTVEVIPSDMQGNMLLTQRSMRKKSGGGQYEFPAGSVISGETEQQAAVRELKEETGLRPSKLYLLQIARSPGIIRYTYLAYIPNLMDKKIVYPPEEVMGHMIVDYDTWMTMLTTDQYNHFRTNSYNAKLYATVKKLVHTYAQEKAPETDFQTPQSSQPRTLVAANKLKSKVHLTDEERYRETDEPELPNGEPSVEQGDDGT